MKRRRNQKSLSVARREWNERMRERKQREYRVRNRISDLVDCMDEHDAKHVLSVILSISVIDHMRGPVDPFTPSPRVIYKREKKKS